MSMHSNQFNNPRIKWNEPHAFLLFHFFSLADVNRYDCFRMPKCDENRNLNCKFAFVACVLNKNRKVQRIKKNQPQYYHKHTHSRAQYHRWEMRLNFDCYATRFFFYINVEVKKERLTQKLTFRLTKTILFEKKMQFFLLLSHSMH